MKTVLKIYLDDVTNLVKNFFALTIVVGICFLPALYAWFNIYSNWDPYGNTGALKIAAVSLDKGFTDEEGEYHNQGDTIIENLHENTAINWQFVENADEAINGVYSGEYYAAVIVDEKFTYNMYNILTEEVDRPTLHFYENQKKNPVATKISDTVVQNLQNNINVAFTEVVVSEVFSSASDVSDELQEENSVETALDKLRQLSADLTAYQTTINSIIENDAQLQTSLALAEQDASNLQNQTQAAADAIADTATESQVAATTLDTYNKDINAAINLINTYLTEMGQGIDTAKLSTDAKTVSGEVVNVLLSVEYIQEIGSALKETANEDLRDQVEQVLQLVNQLEENQVKPLVEQLQNLSDTLGSVSEQIQNSGLSGFSDEQIEKIKNLPIPAEYKEPYLQAIETLQGVQNSQLETVANSQAAINLIVGKINEKQAEVDNTIAIINKLLETPTDADTIQENINGINSINEDILALVGQENLNAILQDGKPQVVTIKTKVENELANTAITGLSTLSGTLNNANALLNSVGETFGNLMVMFNAMDNTIDCTNTSLEKTNEAIVYVNGRLIDAINEVENAATNDKMQVLVNALSGDPEMYGKFFSTPVEVVTEAVYPVENYGSAVAPFYSTLAFWVGALILTAIIKIHPNKNKYPDASHRQLFFGRYVLFWILGQIQAIVIVLGDLYLLHVQCVHPVLFLLAASVIATTFTILIYSIVATWGDAGKALAVVIVVIQIAGSSGTYPIELLPDFFKKVYIFFPFPYAINAIRECLCGMYELDYLKYLGCLGIFIIVSLIIGLLIKIPFEPINHYMEERMEDTEMM